MNLLLESIYLLEQRLRSIIDHGVRDSFDSQRKGDRDRCDVDEWTRRLRSVLAKNSIK